MGEQAGLYSNNGIEDNSFAAAIAAQAAAEAEAQAKAVAEAQEKAAAEAQALATRRAQEAEAARVAAETARREAEKIAAQAAEEAQRKAEEAERLRIEAETARRIVEQEEESARAAREAREEAERQVRAREEAKARAIEAERQAQMAEKIAEEYRQKARAARSEAAFTGDAAGSAGPAVNSNNLQNGATAQSTETAETHTGLNRGGTSGTDRHQGTDGNGSEYAAGSVPGEPARGVETKSLADTSRGRLRIGSKMKNSVEIGLVLLLCAATIAVQTVSVTGFFKKNRENVSAGYEKTVVEIVDYEDGLEGETPATAIGVSDQTVDPWSDAGAEQTVDQQSVTGEEQTRSTTAAIIDRMSAFGETIEVKPDFAAFDAEKTYKGFSIIPVIPVTWVDGDYSVSLTGVSGSKMEPYLLYDVRVSNPEIADKITSIEPRIIVLSPEEYATNLDSYADWVMTESTKDPDDPELFHMITRNYTWVSQGEDFVHDLTGLYLKVGGAGMLQDVNMQSVLHIDSELFADSVQLYSNLGPYEGQRVRYGDLEWFDIFVNFYSDEVDCLIHFDGIPGTDAELTPKIWREFAGKLRLVVNGETFEPIPGTAGGVEQGYEGDYYSWIYFQPMQINNGDEVYLEVDGERMVFDTGYIH